MLTLDWLRTLRADPLDNAAPFLIAEDKEITVAQKKSAGAYPYVRLQWSRDVVAVKLYGYTNIKQVNLDLVIYQAAASTPSAPHPQLVNPQRIVNLYREIEYSLAREVNEFHMGALIKDGIEPGSGTIYPMEQPDKSYMALLTFTYKFKK